MSDTREINSDEHASSSEGDVESLSFSVTTSPRSLVKVGLELEYFEILVSLNHVTVIRPSDSFKRKSAQQRHAADLSVVNSKTSRMVCQIALSPNANAPRPLMRAINPMTKNLMTAIVLSTL